MTTGITINGGVNPAIDLNIDQATKGSGAGTLSVYFVNGLFGPSAGIWALAVSQGGTIPSGITSTAYDSIGAGSLPGGLTALGTLSSGNSISGSLNSGESQHYLAIGDAITSSQTSVDIGLSVPDGGSTAAMLGLALSGLGLVVRKVRRS